MKDYVLTREYLSITGMIQNQFSQWTRETGDQPTSLTLPDALFDRLCAETADHLMRKDKNILSMIESLKMSLPTQDVLIIRDKKK